MSEYNAIVKSHDIKLSGDGERLLFYMDLELPNSGGVGFMFDGPVSDSDNNSFAHGLGEVMKVLDVSEVSEIDGRPLIAVFDGEMFLGSKIIGIRHFLGKYSFIEK